VTITRAIMAASALAATLSLAPVAFADVSNDPSNACFPEGDPCDNAGPGEDQEGECVLTSEGCPFSEECLRCFTDEDNPEGCAVSGTTRDGSILGAMLALGALGLFIERRRNK
jgi:MYXO-CTERM domain-containing protein